VTAVPSVGSLEHVGMKIAQPQPENFRRKRRWFHYSLRTMLLLITAVALSLGVVVHNASVQREALQAIQRAHGTVFYDFHQTAPRTVSSVGKPTGPQWLRAWLDEHYFDTAVWISFFGTPNDDEWVSAVNNLPSLNTLLLSGENATDEILDRLRRSPKLEDLHLSGGQVTDQGLANLAKFPNLRWLIMNHTRIADSGLGHVRRLEHLEELILTDTAISNEGIDDLVAMTRLQRLDVRRTAITPDGLRELQKALPKCRVLSQAKQSAAAQW
jgi:hypothetical protein